MGDFLEDWCHYGSFGECPEIFHTWSALSAVSAAVGRKVWLDQGQYEVFPHLFVFLVGDSGSKKSTAISKARKGIGRHWPEILGPETSSDASITDIMLENERVFMWENREWTYYPMFLAVGEASHFFVTQDVRQMVIFLTTIHDSDYYRRKTRGGGQQVIERPYLNLLMGCVPEWLRSNLKRSMLKEGLGRRILPVYGRKTKRVPRPIVSDDGKAALERCYDRLAGIAKLEGPLEWTLEATRWFDKWYMDQEEPESGSVWANYWNSRGDQLLKTALLLEVANGDDLRLRAETLDRALELLQGVESQMNSIYQGMGENPLDQLHQRALETIGVEGSIGEKDLLARIWSDLPGPDQEKNWKEILRQLLNNGVEREVVNNRKVLKKKG